MSEHLDDPDDVTLGSADHSKLQLEFNFPACILKLTFRLGLRLIGRQNTPPPILYPSYIHWH
jgi:hypothetical protein